jgi:hypothetical protein
VVRKKMMRVSRVAGPRNRRREPEKNVNITKEIRVKIQQRPCNARASYQGWVGSILETPSAEETLEQEKEEKNRRGENSKVGS